VRVAAVDCGTNSLRLLIAEQRGAELAELHRDMRIVRLGAGVAATGLLSTDALDRVAATLDDYARQIRAHGVTRVRLVATSAARDAGNATELDRLVRDRLGVPAEIVTGGQEAELSLRGVLTAIREPTGTAVLVADIGGGSTELVTGTADTLAVASLPAGSVRLTERFLPDDPPTAAQVTALKAFVRHELAGVDGPILDAAKHGVVVGVAGTVTTVAGLALGLGVYDRHRIDRSVLTARQVDEVTEQLVRWSRPERAARRVIHPGRVDVIAAGALILQAVLAWGGVRRIVVSEADILDGIAAGLLDREGSAPIAGRPVTPTCPEPPSAG
jgi:exopolyphosphatase / guanosine-5'-triphosphate,3'-diphosphate pyrophosphatase